MEISTERYVDVIVDFLDRVGYSDPEGRREERAENLCHVFRRTMEHFSRTQDRGMFPDHQYVKGVVRTITRMTVFGWENLPRNTMVPLNIYFTYVILEDDPRDDPGDDPFQEKSSLMDSFACDLLAGREQSYSRFSSLFAFFPQLLACYGKFSQLTMLKSTLELFQGFWIESRGFHGFPGSSDYPMFLRRLNGLGDFSGATLFPAALFDEDRQFGDIVTVIAQIEPIVALVNDLFSFYKEASAAEVCLVNSICVTEGVDTEQALRRVARDSVTAVQKLTGVLATRQSPTVQKTVEDFVRGYIRWHLCDERYRMRDLSVHSAGGGTNAVKFRQFHDAACRAGCVDLVDFQTL